MAGSIIQSEDRLAEIVRAVRSVAVIGIKDGTDPDAPAFAIPGLLRARGIRVLGVNPKIREFHREPVVPAIASVPDRVDVVQIFRRSENVPAHADEILALPPERRPSVVWMQTGIRNDAAARRLTEAGIDVVMDRCLGVYAVRYRRGGASPGTDAPAAPSRPPE
ncbi:MAG TPA: CoA-binding protein [Candidatus Eisenbacteria bacterium]|nr:CoA-binding protein [Candidatus Eisenbacteria bacterium]